MVMLWHSILNFNHWFSWIAGKWGKSSWLPLWRTFPQFQATSHFLRMCGLKRSTLMLSRTLRKRPTNCFLFGSSQPNMEHAFLMRTPAQSSLVSYTEGFGQGHEIFKLSDLCFSNFQFWRVTMPTDFSASVVTVQLPILEVRTRSFSVQWPGLAEMLMKWRSCMRSWKTLEQDGSLLRKTLSMPLDTSPSNQETGSKWALLYYPFMDDENSF